MSLKQNEVFKYLMILMQTIYNTNSPFLYSYSNCDLISTNKHGQLYAFICWWLKVWTQIQLNQCWWTYYFVSMLKAAS